MRQFKYTYTITSERAHRRNDEIDNELRSNHEYEVGQVIELDGLLWTVTGVKETTPDIQKVRYDVIDSEMKGVGFCSRDQREAFEMAKKIAAQDRFGEAFMTRNIWDSEGQITVNTVAVRQDGSFRRF